MSNFTIKAGHVAGAARSTRNIIALYEYKRILEEMSNKTDLEINALKGLKYSLTFKWIVAIITVIGIVWGTWIFCIACTGGLETPEHNIETGYVKDGYIKYGRDDALYDVSELGYEEGTWLNIYISKDTGEVEMVDDMFKVKEEEAREEGRLLIQSAVILGTTIIFLVVGLSIALCVFEKPFRKWYKIYTQTHPSLF